MQTVKNTALENARISLETKLTLNNGTFLGTKISPSELRLHSESNEIGVPSYRAQWPHQPRLRLAQQKFSPFEGWSFVADVVASTIRMSTRRPINGVMTETGPHETQLHIASLLKNNVVIAKASSLAALDVEKAHESGENNAISRLLDHLGLPAHISLTQAEYDVLTHSADFIEPANTSQPLAKSTVLTVVPIPYVTRSQNGSQADAETPSAANTGSSSTDGSQEQSEVGKVDIVSPESNNAAIGTSAQLNSNATTTPITSRTRNRALNLWRAKRRGQDYPEPTTEEDALALIDQLGKA